MSAAAAIAALHRSRTPCSRSSRISFIMILLRPLSFDCPILLGYISQKIILKYQRYYNIKAAYLIPCRDETCLKLGKERKTVGICGDERGCDAKQILRTAAPVYGQTRNPERSSASNPVSSSLTRRSISSAPPSLSASMFSGIFGSWSDIRSSAHPPSMTRRTPS